MFAARPDDTCHISQQIGLEEARCVQSLFFFASLKHLRTFNNAFHFCSLKAFQLVLFWNMIICFTLFAARCDDTCHITQQSGLIKITPW